MTNLERVRNYISREKRLGNLKSGDRLPSYNEFTEMFQISYQTVSSIFSKLSKEGLVETRKGSGSYLAGGTPLRVLVNIQPTTISVANMKNLLKKHLADANLHLEIVVRPAQHLSDPAVRSRAAGEFKAAVSIHPICVEDDQLPAALLSQFPDYKKVLNGLNVIEGVNYDCSLPFTQNSYLIGVNRNLLEKLGWDLADLTPDFLWWDSFAESCRRAGFLPASADYVPQGALLFQEFQNLLLALQAYSVEKYKGEVPLFRTPEGRLFLRIVRDTGAITETLSDPRSFYQNGAVFCWRCGSWLTVQNHAAERPDKAVDSLFFLPYRDRNGERFTVFDQNCLKAYLRPDILPDERLRIWELMKIMVSRNFQLDYCSATGMISGAKGISPDEYQWNRDNRYAAFFPADEKKILYPRLFSPMRQTAMFSMLLENWKFYQASEKETLERLELKKHFYRSRIPEGMLKEEQS